MLSLLGIVACGDTAVEDLQVGDLQAGVAQEPGASRELVLIGEPQSTAALWAASCALCHVDGTGGAPRIGNQQEWGPRLAQSKETLLAHTLEGLNQMPPLGYCMACERDDFLALIDMMTTGLSATEADQ